MIQESIGRGLMFIADEDARPDGGAHPQAHLWDNGEDAVHELKHILKVRELALSRFSEKNIRKGSPLATLEEVLVPIYLFHRYQIISASKLIGGVDYSYALRGDNQKPHRPVPAEAQNRALEALLLALQPETLALPDNIIKLIPPRPFGYPRWRETFTARTGVTFDQLAPVEAASNMVIYLLLHPERAARLVQLHSENPQLPGLSDTIDKLLAATWQKPAGEDYEGEIRRVVNMVSLYYLMNLAANDKAPAQVRAIAHQKLGQLKEWLKVKIGSEKSTGQRAHFQYAFAEIIRFEENPKEMRLTPPLDPPPGAPIGAW
jgi:hypothetical protein